MIVVRAHSALGIAYVTANALVAHDGLGNPVPQRAVHLDTRTYDVTGALGAGRVGLMMRRWSTDLDHWVAEEFGGWHNLL